VTPEIEHDAKDNLKMRILSKESPSDAQRVHILKESLAACQLLNASKLTIITLKSSGEKYRVAPEVASCN